jgi:aromatic ring-opening dioxygenase LigB subunit
MPALGGDKALAWCFANHTNSCVHLTEARIKSIIIALFRERKQELKCDMMRRSGGQIIASDATHKTERPAG